MPVNHERLERMINEKIKTLHRNEETIGENYLRKVEIGRLQHKANVKHAILGLPKMVRDLNFVNLNRNKRLKWNIEAK